MNRALAPSGMAFSICLIALLSACGSLNGASRYHGPELEEGYAYSSFGLEPTFLGTDYDSVDGNSINDAIRESEEYRNVSLSGCDGVYGGTLICHREGSDDAGTRYFDFYSYDLEAGSFSFLRRIRRFHLICADDEAVFFRNEEGDTISRLPFKDLVTDGEPAIMDFPCRADGMITKAQYEDGMLFVLGDGLAIIVGEARITVPDLAGFHYQNGLVAILKPGSLVVNRIILSGSTPTLSPLREYPEGRAGDDVLFVDNDEIILERGLSAWSAFEIYVEFISVGATGTRVIGNACRCAGAAFMEKRMR